MCDSTYLPSIESQSKDSFHDYLYDFTIPLYKCFKSLDISSRYFLSIIGNCLLWRVNSEKNSLFVFTRTKDYFDVLKIYTSNLN